MTTPYLERYLWRGPSYSTLYNMLRHALFNLPVRDIVDEFTSLLTELAGGTGTLCKLREFMVSASVTLNMILSEAKENTALRDILVEKAVNVMEVCFSVINELGKDRLSCKVVEEGIIEIRKILKEVDELLKKDAS